jgi:hypothetical protein
MLVILGCKKEQEQQTSNSSLIGLWQVTLLTISRYDSLNNIISVDTVIYIDQYGNDVTLLEKYTQDNKFYIFLNTTSDTNKISTYMLNGNNLKINLPDTVFPFNNRTISQIDDKYLELFQIITMGSLKEKWIQRYLKK